MRKFDYSKMTYNGISIKQYCIDNGIDFKLVCRRIREGMSVVRAIEQPRCDKRPNLIGKIFGRLTVLRKLEATKIAGQFWECQCDCGTITKVSTGALNGKHTLSCGCLQRECSSKALRELRTIHGESGTPIYVAWVRACNPNQNGGYGVTDAWKGNYAEFKQWSLMNGYQEGFVFIRKDKSDLFTPDNCAWIDKSTYYTSLSMRNTKHYIDDVSLADKCRDLGLKYETIRRRIIDVGMSPHEAITIELNVNHHGETRISLYNTWTKTFISRCPEWDDWKTFKEWALSNGYSETVDLTRRNLNEPHSPTNSIFLDKWQLAHKYNTKYFYNGVPITVICRQLGINANIVRQRIRRDGWSTHKAIYAAIETRYSKKAHSRYYYLDENAWKKDVISRGGLNNLIKQILSQNDFEFE